jgi:glycosyltransferase involved in cell wall biosynthesis
MNDHSLSVIIPSLAAGSRAQSIHRAIDSILGQQNVRAIPIVVVNGTRHDPTVLHWLGARRDLRMISIEGGLVEARSTGRNAVDTPFFAFLDDDDELLPNSVAIRLKPLLEQNSVDVVVSNGFRETESGIIVTNPEIEQCQRDPLRALLDSCWLNSNGGLYRTETVGPEFFVNLPPILEWTYLALQLSASRSIHFLDVQTFLTHNTPQSLSKSKRFLLEEPLVLQRILNLPLPEDLRAGFRRKYANALHKVSMQYLEDDDFRPAWKYHMQSALTRGGWRYLSYTRHIVRKQLANAGKPRLGG